MKNNVSIKSVSTPTNIEEFRNNLSKYFMRIEKNKINVMDKHGVDIDKLNSLSDLYRIIGDTEIYIVPLVDISKKTLIDYMHKTGQLFSCNGFFEDDSNFKLFENQNLYLKSSKNINWIRIDNPIYSELFNKLLGNFQ
jgi:hypothetical protein